jgi:hypothetical protein
MLAAKRSTALHHTPWPITLQLCFLQFDCKGQLHAHLYALSMLPLGTTHSALSRKRKRSNSRHQESAGPAVLKSLKSQCNDDVVAVIEKVEALCSAAVLVHNMHAGRCSLHIY